MTAPQYSRRRATDAPDSPEFERRDDRHWHLDKKLNISHLVATAGVIVALFTWSGKIDTRMALLEKQFENQKVIDERQDRDTRDGIIALQAAIQNVALKLDRLIESRNGRERGN